MDLSWTHSTFQLSAGFRLYQRNHQSDSEQKPPHLVPLVRNFPFVDSIIYDPDEVLTCVQITASRNHDVLVSGLQRIQRLFRRGTSLEGLYPSKDRPWRLVFVVPPSDEVCFTSQRLKGDTALDEWAGRVHQYVLGLDVIRKNQL